MGPGDIDQQEVTDRLHYRSDRIPEQVKREAVKQVFAAMNRREKLRIHISNRRECMTDGCDDPAKTVVVRDRDDPESMIAVCFLHEAGPGDDDGN